MISEKEREELEYKFALQRIEELLPLTGDDKDPFSKEQIELLIMSDVVINYEQKYYPIPKPTPAQMLQATMEEREISQKTLAEMVGVSPSRISDYITGRAEPTLKIARRLCKVLNISPALMMGL